jgi:hypothetical protein
MSKYPRAPADTDGLAAGEAQIEAVRGGRRGCSSGRLSRYCGGASSLPTVAEAPPPDLEFVISRHRFKFQPTSIS